MVTMASRHVPGGTDPELAVKPSRVGDAALFWEALLLSLARDRHRRGSHSVAEAQSVHAHGTTYYASVNGGDDILVCKSEYVGDIAAVDAPQFVGDGLLKEEGRSRRDGSQGRVGGKLDEDSRDLSGPRLSAQSNSLCWRGDAGGGIDSHSLGHSWTYMSTGVPWKHLGAELAMRLPFPNGRRQMDDRS